LNIKNQLQDENFKGGTGDLEIYPKARGCTGKVTITNTGKWNFNPAKQSFCLKKYLISFFTKLSDIYFAYLFIHFVSYGAVSNSA
jgi:hypothetical protein